MSIFVDTSAFLAILNADDERHSEAAKIWKYPVTHGETMICSCNVNPSLINMPR